jgi:hypothetical protein
MLKVTPPNYSSLYLHVNPPSRAYRNGFALKLDKDSAAEKQGSSFFIKNSRKRSPEYLAFGLAEPKRIATGRAKSCSACDVSDVQTQVQTIYESRQQLPQEPDAGIKKYATVTIQILQEYLNIAMGRRRYDEIAIAEFMTSNNLDPRDSIYFSRHTLTPEGRKLLVWLENAEHANGLPKEASDAFFTSTAHLTDDSSTALLVGARNLECALAWYCLPETMRMPIMEFCAANTLSYSSLQKHFFGGGMLRDKMQDRLIKRYGIDVETVICMARKALQNDAGHTYISPTGKVMPEWKALLLWCQIDSAAQRNYLTPIPSATPAPALPRYWPD